MLIYAAQRVGLALVICIIAMTMLFDAGRSLEERVLAEQFSA